MTTTAGRNSPACATSSAAEVCAASACTPNRSGSLRTTSSAWVPMEPVEPIRLTVRIRSPEVDRLDHEVRGGEDEEEAVEPVQDAPVAGQEAAHVLDAEMPLDHGLAEVAERRHDRHHDPVHRG